MTVPLVVLALDAGDRELMSRWVAEGRLPTIRSLLDRGCHGTIAGSQIVSELGTWVSTWSGRSRAHGYYSYRQLEPGTYDLVPRSPADADAEPFWAELRGSGLRCAIVDPPEAVLVPGLDGAQLTNWLTAQPATAAQAPQAEPAQLIETAHGISRTTPAVVPFVPRGRVADDRKAHEALLQSVADRVALCRSVLAQGPFDFVLVGFGEVHKASHRFWDYRPEAVGSELARSDPALENGIRDLYEATDRALAEILAELPGHNVVLVSTYGMRDDYPTTDLVESFLTELGYRVPAGGEAGGGRPGPLALARRVLPESVRVRLGRRLPLSVQERLIADRFGTGTEWKQTEAFAIPGLYTSYVRVNLIGREPDGIVARGEHYEDVLTRLEEDLYALVDPVDGCPAVELVTRAASLVDGEPPRVLPDLFVRWTASRHLRRRLEHPRAAVTQAVPGFLRGSEHSIEGFFAASGPGIEARGAIGTVSLLDVAPTLLALLDRPAPESMIGLPLAVLGSTELGARW